MADDGYTIHVIEYPFGGGKWLLEVPARSFADAEARIAAAAAWGECIGSNAQTVPAAVGFLAPLWCWWRNRRQRAR
ncbi:MAG TPA: hypothetical protein VFU47_06010 [Armatimonadota bacterium]|nr:hypothetical protein [Armatimonadota bacterium]